MAGWLSSTSGKNERQDDNEATWEDLVGFLFYSMRSLFGDASHIRSVRQPSVRPFDHYTNGRPGFAV